MEKNKKNYSVTQGFMTNSNTLRTFIQQQLKCEKNVKVLWIE